MASGSFWPTEIVAVIGAAEEEEEKRRGLGCGLSLRGR